MKKLKVMVPTIALFALPWTQRLLYENWILAWPNADAATVHVIVAIATVAACLVTAMILDFLS